MPLSSERELVLGHALESTTNMEMALDIAFAYRDLRRRVIGDYFVVQLECKVRQALDAAEWKLITTMRENPFARFASFCVAKKNWEGRYGVGLEAQMGDARSFLVGIWKDHQGRPPITGLKEKLDIQIRQGQVSNRWDWFHYLDHPYRDWDKEALMQMYNGNAAARLGEYLVNLATLAAPTIDSHVRVMPT